jgi:heterotetrameric sarcosine oxidase gamma subunit
VSTVDTPTSWAPIAAPELLVAIDEDVRAASLRYFASMAGGISGSIEAAVRLSLPGALKATRVSTDGRQETSILAWLSPTETLLLSTNDVRFDQLAACTTVAGGYFVDQTDGFSVIKLTGKGAEDLLIRIGLSDSFPDLGEAKRSRMADISVLALRVCREETLLVVNRTYTEHLMNWIRVSALDVEPSGTL